ncbi:MAG: hypothetical protein K1X39_06050 [Thermoflexales bacterium]|nr:hypothetical protein [Thermoflexales bacterium]
MNERLRAWRRCLERGEAETAEFTIAIVPMVLLISLIAAAAIIRPAQLPALFAAQACARAASVSLDSSIGVRQGIQAAADSLTGNNLATAQASIRVWSAGPWERGASVTCAIAYHVDVSGLPLVGGAFGVIDIAAQSSARIEPSKARWETHAP